MSPSARGPEKYDWSDDEELEWADETPEEIMRRIGLHLEEPVNTSDGTRSSSQVHTGATASIVCEIWEEYHGPLNPKWRDEFLLYPFMPELIRHPIGRIREAIRTHKKLDAVLEELDQPSRERGGR